MKVSTPLWRVRIVEMDRFSGPEVLSTDTYDNEREARRAAAEVNSKNTAAEVPDCYVFADVERVG